MSPSFATRLRVGDQWVEYVDDERLDLTSDPERAQWYSWSGAYEAEQLVKLHLELREGKAS